MKSRRQTYSWIWRISKIELDKIRGSTKRPLHSWRFSSFFSHDSMRVESPHFSKWLKIITKRVEESQHKVRARRLVPPMKIEFFGWPNLKNPAPPQRCIALGLFLANRDWLTDKIEFNCFWRKRKKSDKMPRGGVIQRRNFLRWARKFQHRQFSR